MTIAEIKLIKLPMIKISTNRSSSNFFNRATDFTVRMKPITNGMFKTIDMIINNLSSIPIVNPPSAAPFFLLFFSGW